MSYEAANYLSLWKGAVRVPRHPVKLTRPTLQGVLEEVYDLTGVSPAEVMEDTHVHRIAHARQLAMWKLRRFRAHDAYRYSLPEIGRVFGRDHTTVLAGCRAVDRRIANGSISPDCLGFSTDNPVIHRASESEQADSTVSKKPVEFAAQ